MTRKDDIQIAKAAGLKRIRAATRLELTLLGDRLLNDLQDDFVREFDKAVAAGRPYELVEYVDWVRDRLKKKVALPSG